MTFYQSHENFNNRKNNILLNALSFIDRVDNTASAQIADDDSLELSIDKGFECRLSKDKLNREDFKALINDENGSNQTGQFQIKNYT